MRQSDMRQSDTRQMGDRHSDTRQSSTRKFSANRHSPGWLRKAGIICFWLFLWQFISIAVDNTIVLVGPAEVFQSLAIQITSLEFWKTIGLTFGKITFGFLCAFLAAVAAGGAAAKFSLIRELLEPVVVLVKSVPVASFVILALIWIGSKNLSVFISFLVVFPIVYVNTIAGLKSADAGLLEMAEVFRMTPGRKVRYIYWPALLPYLTSSVGVALGMGFKSGIAAEVIGVPSHSIGEKLYMAKIYLSTADLFAWTFVIIVISGVFEKFILYLLKKVERQNTADGKRRLG